MSLRVSARLNDQGALVSSDLYDAYGQLRAGNPNNDPVGYCGQWGYYTDHSTGYILCTFRWYDPLTARWLTRDPIGYAGGINLYGYVDGNPVIQHDALGTKKAPLKPPSIGHWERGPQMITRAVPDPTRRTEKGDPKDGAIYNLARAAEKRLFGPAAGHDPDGGSYRHCVAACLLVRRYGWWGYTIRWVHDFLEQDDADSLADIRAEDEGERRASGPNSCEVECASYSNPCRIPPGR